MIHYWLILELSTLEGHDCKVKQKAVLILTTALYVIQSAIIFSPVISYRGNRSLCCWMCGRGCEWNFYSGPSACRWMKSTYYAAKVPIFIVCVCACVPVCVCVCISPHYTLCVDLSRRVTPEGRSPALLRSDALNYTTLTLIAEAQEHTGRGISAYVLSSRLKHRVWMWRIFPGADMSAHYTITSVRLSPTHRKCVLLRGA